MKRVLIFLICFTTIIFAQKKARNDWQSLIEQFPEGKSVPSEAQNIFTDNALSKLRKGTNVKNIQNPLLKKIATEMSKKKYDTRRIQKYEAYPDPNETARKLKTSSYSRFDNVTGIYFEPNEEVIILVENADDEKLELRVHDFGESGDNHTYSLNSGVNKIKMNGSGNGYIQFYRENYEKAKPITIHIIGGKVNGYFDIKKHKNKDWKTLLENAVSPILDMRGERVQLAYAVETLKKQCPEKGEELIKLYDEIIKNQHQIMGLEKYKMVPKNRIFGRVIWKGFMHADGMGAAFHDNTMDGLANPDKIPHSTWGIAHEFGHVNQVRPNMKWVGTTEVTNNIYAAWTQYQHTPQNMRLETEHCGAYDGGVLGGRFNAFLTSALVENQEWLTQAGPDRWKRYNEERKDWGGDHFVKLAPLWQLQLYYTVAGKGNSWYKPDFYADIFHRAITSTENSKSHGEFQLEFMRNACEFSNNNLSDFFEKVGMLKPIDKWTDDYSCAQMTITKKQIEEFKAFAKKYKKPTSSVIYYISSNSINIFNHKLPLSGEKAVGTKKEGNNIIVDAEKWKNAVAFETYAGKKLIRAVIFGTNSRDLTSTQVPFPENATRIEAVSWNGKRMTVYEK